MKNRYDNLIAFEGGAGAILILIVSNAILLFVHLCVWLVGNIKILLRS